MVDERQLREDLDFLASWASSYIIERLGSGPRAQAEFDRLNAIVERYGLDSEYLVTPERVRRGW